MKTIKQLEKELKIFRENKGNLGESARIVTFRYLEGQLDSLKEVLEKIDYEIGFLGDVINSTRKGGSASKAVSEVTFIIKRRMEELKQKLVGE